MRNASAAGRAARSPGRLLSTLVVLALLAFTPACSSCRKPVNPVRGQILVDGKPAAKAQVLFHPDPGGNDDPLPTAHTDDQGYFDLTSYKNGDGAPEGSYAVTVTWFRVFGGGKQEIVSRNVLPKRYSAPQSSQLHATIAKGKNDLPAFQLNTR
jgi:hypothetical protein